MISLVIPVYNEERILPDTIAALSGFCTREGVGELIFSDDGSSDGSAALLEEARRRDGRIRLLRNPHRGKGGAVRAGVLASRGETVLFTDCDLAYGADQMAGLLRAHREGGADITVATRTLGEESYGGYSALRRWGSEAMRRLIRLRTGLRVRDIQAGLKCFDGEAARTLFARCRCDGFAFDTEVLLLAQREGRVIGEFPVKMPPQAEQRESRVRPVRDALKMLWEIGRM